MAQPFAVGDVVGGRYRITHHVVTSADQDIVFEGTDQVLNREVSILLASRSNAKQVATSAKELATGERVCDVQVLDLGLAEDRTYLIASLTDPNELLDLVVPDAAPYVEPFFTDSLGSEIFGQSRVMEPETYHDDDEYYAALTESESDSGRRRPSRRRSGFLDRVSDSLNRRLGTSGSSSRRGAGTDAGADAEAEDTLEQLDDDRGAGGDLGQDERAETEEAVSAGREALGQRGGIAEEPQAPVAAYRDAPMPEIPQPELPAHLDDESDEDQRDSEPEPQQPEPAEQPHRDSAQKPQPEPHRQSEEFSGSAEGVSAVKTSRRGRRRRRPERSSGIVAGIPALADLSLAEAGASADTQEAFGVRADDDGGFVQLSEAEASAVSQDPAGDHTEQADHAAQASEAQAEDHGREAHGASADPWAEDPDPEDVVDDPPAEPLTDYDRRRWGTAGAAAAAGSVAAVGETPEPDATAAGAAQDPYDDPDHRESALVGGSAAAGSSGAAGGSGSGPVRWLGLLLLGAVLLVVGVVVFMQLGGGDEVADGDGGDEEDGSGEADSEDEEDEEEDSAPELAISTVTREVPENTELGAEFDGDLENLIDDDDSTSWSTYSYGNASYGGYASEMAVIAELEEPGQVQQVTVDQDPAQQGGSFEVLVNDEATLEGATSVGDGSFGEEPAVVELSEPTEAQYVILNVTELPENSEPENPDLPYRLDLRELDVS